jgi:serine/threonine protein kinase
MELLEVLGEGAMGWVFRAHHRTLNKVVAIKVIKKSGDAEGRSTRFQREAQSAAKFDHPNTVQILDFGEDGEDRLLYLAMEYLEGRDLQRALKDEGPFNGRRLCEIMIQTLGALAAAHDQGVIHRDIKPANIMIVMRPNDDGEMVEFVKVCDFGLAKMLAAGTARTLDGVHPTLVGMVVGTPAYMAPEQAVNETIDPRTDVYACGVVMYEMLTGQVPFDAETPMALLLKHVSEAPRPPSQIVPTIDPALESIVLWTLEKQPVRRCPSARELRRALKEYLAGSNALRTTQNLISDLTLDMRPRPISRPIAPLTPPPLTPPPLPLRRPVSIPQPVPRAPDPSDERTSSAEMLPVEAIIGPAAGTADLPKMESGDVPSNVIALDTNNTGKMDALIAESFGMAPAPPPPVVVKPPPSEFEADPEVDHRRHAAALAERAQYMWRHYGIMFEPYKGGDPFWVLDHNNESMGPLVYSDALRVVRSEGEAGNGATTFISHDGETWMAAQEFVRLSGQEALLHRPLPAKLTDKRTLAGKLDGGTLTSLFARVAKEGSTGRLLFESVDFGEKSYAELHLVNGKPTFVFVTDLSLQLPQILVRKKLIEERMIPRVLHRVLADESPLEDIVERQTMLDLRSYRAAFMKERLYYIFDLKRCEYRLDSEVLPASAKPFSPSLLALLPEFVYRRMSANELRHIVWPKIELRLQRSERFNAAIAEMGLTDAQLNIVRRLAKGPSLSEPIKKCELKEEKLYLTMAYILLECELLLRPI